MKHLISAGFLIQSRNKFLLCHQTSDQKSSLNDRRWTIPRGIAHEGESPLAAAARETFEETGIMVAEIENIQIADQPFWISHEYQSSDRGEDVKKQIVTFLAVDRLGYAQESKLRCSSLIDFGPRKGLPEIDDFIWATITEALQSCGRQVEPLFIKVKQSQQTKG